MSQSPRKPQSKWGSPPEGPSGTPPKTDVPPAAKVPAPAPVESAPTAVPAPPAAALGTWPGAAVAPGAPVTPAAVPGVAGVPASVASASAIAGDADSLMDGPAFDDEPAPHLTLKDRLHRLSPAYVTLTVVSIGSLLFLSLAMTSHTTPVAVLMSAGVVTLLAFALDTAICTNASYEAGRQENAGRALLFALLGGVSALICALSMAGTLIMILVLTG